MSSPCVVKDVEKASVTKSSGLFLLKEKSFVPVRTAMQHDPVRSWSLSGGKRAFDFAIAFAVLLVFGIPMLLIAIAVRLTSRGPAIFVQQRVGRGGRMFSIYKFRSMELPPKNGVGSGLTAAGDSRVTMLGAWLRKLKLDELPQFYNILRGDMSLVGPRPKMPQFAEELTSAYRPGITGAASIAFRREEEMLGKLRPEEVESYYQERIKPLKARIDFRYMSRATLFSDVRIIATTFLTVFRPAPAPKVNTKPVMRVTPAALQIAEPTGD